MQRHISTPILLEEILGDFQLKFSEVSIRQAALDHLPADERLDAVQGFLASPGPLVSVGQPQWWNLSPYIRRQAAKYPDAPGLTDLLAQLKEAEFYLVRVGCAFHPDVEKPVKSAFFSGYFRPQYGKTEVTVLDILPGGPNNQRMNYGLMHWNLSTRLFFSPADIPVEEILLEIEFKNLIPIISGEMGLVASPGWNYRSKDVEGLVDSRYGYFLIQKPRTARHVLLRQDLSVEVQTSLGLLKADVKEKDRPRLSHLICSEWIEV